MGRNSSLKRWLMTTNHKDVGILYLVTSLYFFIVAGTLALLMRLQLAVPENNFLTAGRYNEAVTNHGLLMVFWFLSPLGFAFANYFVPIQIGAKDMAFPRLNALSYWLLLFGGLLVLAGFFMPGGTADFGWTVYAPLNTDEFTPNPGANLVAFGLLMLVASVIVGTVNFVTTIGLLRAKGYRYSNLPMFTIGILITVLLMLWAFPSLQAGLVLLAADRLLDARIFSAPEGGSILWDHLFWFFGHPEVYIVLIPALGAVLDIISVFSRRPLYAKKAMIASIVVAGILSYMVYAHHMFMTGVKTFYLELHSLTTEAISVPFGVITLLAIATMIGGLIRLSTPMLFALGSISVFIIGGITGVFNSSIVIDTANRGSYWVVGHFHYVMVGAALFGLFGAFYYWFPKMTGRMYNESLGRLHFILSFIGFNILYFPMFLLIDMPRRVFTYPEWTGWGPLNFIATIGGFIFGLSHLIMFINFLYSMKKGPLVDNNPWGSWTYEWLIESPPSEFNFDGIPIVSGNRLMISLANGASHNHLHTGDHYSIWPFAISAGPFLALLGLGMMVAGVGGGMPLLVIGLIVALIAVVGWAREDYREKFHDLEPLESKETWPFNGIGKYKLGMWVFLFGDAVFFAGLLGSNFFVRATNPLLPSGPEVKNIIVGALATIIMIASALSVYIAARATRLGNQRMVLQGLGLGLVLAISFTLITALDWMQTFRQGFTLENPAIATGFIAVFSHLLHLGAGLIPLLYFMIKIAAKGLRDGMQDSMDALSLYWNFLAVVSIGIYAVLYLF
ncbi:MAG: cbb3-type cytochrome c oxidase subunit I [Desulfurococcales archaeon]|nr:cbb3-type cytochrome c oxidase subunit I [Desulfurococcales archaeon]